MPVNRLYYITDNYCLPPYQPAHLWNNTARGLCSLTPFIQCRQQYPAVERHKMARLIPRIVISWVAHLSFITVAEGAEINVLVSADKIMENATLSANGSRAAIDSTALDNATLQQSVDSFTICMRLKFRNDA